MCCVGREQGAALDFFQVQILCALVLQAAGFHTREERERLFTIVKAGGDRIDLGILRGVSFGLCRFAEHDHVGSSPTIRDMHS